MAKWAGAPELAGVNMELSRPINPSTPDGRRVALIFEAALHGGGLVACGWCGDWLRINRDLPAGAVSHGICAACEARMMAESEAYLSTVAESNAHPSKCVVHPSPSAPAAVESLCQA